MITKTSPCNAEHAFTRIFAGKFRKKPFDFHSLFCYNKKMRSICLIFEVWHKEKILSMLDTFASESFIHDHEALQGERQWNYLFETEGTFYMHCNECTIHRIKDEKFEDGFEYNLEDMNENSLFIRDEKGWAIQDIYKDTATIEILCSMQKIVLLSVDISGRADSTPEIFLLVKTFLSEISGYVMDDYTEHLWTLDEIKNRTRHNRHVFFDFKGWFDEGKIGPFAEFGIVDKISHTKDYGKYEPQKYYVF